MWRNEMKNKIIGNILDALQDFSEDEDQDGE